MEMPLLNMHFSHDEMIDYLLGRGYVLYQGQREVEDNVYQNVFVASVQYRERVWKDGIEFRVEEAFRLELKSKILEL